MSENFAVDAVKFREDFLPLSVPRCVIASQVSQTAYPSRARRFMSARARLSSPVAREKISRSHTFFRDSSIALARRLFISSRLSADDASSSMVVTEKPGMRTPSGVRVFVLWAG